MPDLDRPPPRVLEFLNAHARRSEDGDLYFVDTDECVILDTDKPGCPYADARAVAAWSRTYKPDLWRETDISVETETAGEPSTISELMAAVRSGAVSSDQAAAALPRFMNPLAANKTITSKPEQPNLTQLMMKAKSGDASAIVQFSTIAGNRL